MSSPVVETVRSIPLIVEKDNPLEHEILIKGYPFEREPNRDFRTQLEDIAKRHPEFAEHLGNFSQDRPRPHHSTENTDQPRRASARPFGDRFERFGFPFDRDDFDPEEYAQKFYQPHQEFYQQEGPSHYQQPPPQPDYQPSSPKAPDNVPATEAPPAPAPEKSNLQQSSTIDLGQKQEPVNDRSQRSVSAPPSESHNPSVNKPSENMSQQHESKATNERIIPIHIEGRDEPVLPKNVPPSFSQPHPAPQAERLFGQRPEQFTQFLNREPRSFSDNWPGFGPEEHVRQPRYQPQHGMPHYQPQKPQQQAPPPQPKEDIPIPVQREAPPKNQQQPREPSPQPEVAKPPPQQQKPLTPIDHIQEIQKDVSALMGQVEQFGGKPRDKDYLYLDEMLTRNLIKLDNIDTQGQENIRSARKEAIKCIERAIGVLDAKAAANVQPPKEPEKMEVEEKVQEAPVETTKEEEKAVQLMEAEPAAVNKEEESQQRMEVVPEVSSDNTNTADDLNKVETVIEVPKQEVVVDAKPVEESKVEQVETCEGQENNLAVADAVKKFEEKDKDTKESVEGANSENKEDVVKESENKDEKKVKKGKKKVEKKEK